MSSRPIRLLLVGLAVAAIWCPAAADGQPYRKGDPVTINGRVLDGDGNTIADVTILLELSRKSFQLRKMRRVRGDTLSVPVTSGPDGTYRHLWHWDGYYNTFELAVSLPVSRGGREVFEVIHRIDITRTVEQGGSIDVPLVIEDTGFLRWLRRFRDGSASSEEHRIFDELGRPDRIDSHGGGAYAWWYFAAGKVYRFSDGTLEQIEPFEPIKPI